MSFRNIFGLTITISTFIILTTALDDYSCYCLDQTKNEKFCVLDRGTVSQMSISHNRYTRGDLAMGLVLKNYLKATDMLYIKWNQELAEKAQQYANNCPDKQMTDPEPLPNGFYLTQNFAIKEFHVQPDISRRFVRFRKVFSEWKDEPKYGSGDRELDGKSNRTNIIRSSTWQMGCGIGVSVKESEGKYREHYVCYYETGKADDGKPLYRVGCKICENCPENTICDEHEGIGLCTSRRVAPKFPSEENQIDDVHSCKEKDIKEETDNKNLLWQCNDWKSQNCIVRGICSYTWIIEKDKGFKIENYPLQNTVTSFLFYKKIYLEKESCYSFKYKQFALRNTYSQLAIMAFPNGDINELLWKLMSHGEGIEAIISLYLPWKDTHVQVGASVKSLNVDEYEDFIELEDFKIVAGKCRKPKY